MRTLISLTRGEWLLLLLSVLVLVLDHTAEQKEPRLSSASDLDGREKPQPSTTLSDV